MTVLWSLLGAALLVFEVLLLVRFAVDWVWGLSPATAPGPSAPVRRITHAMTEPVLAPVRRVLRPVRLGSVTVDLALPVVFVLLAVLRSVLPAL